MARKHNVSNWLAAHDAFKRARNKYQGRLISKETRVVLSRVSPEPFNSDRAVYAIQYWATEIVRFYPNGDIEVCLQGHESKTTKVRAEQHAGVRIWGTKGMHYLVPNMGQSSLVIPADLEKSYIIDTKSGTVRHPDGAVYDKDMMLGRKPKPLPKSRNPAKDPKVGDVLVNKSGEKWLILPMSRAEQDLEMVRYFGDDSFEPSCSHVDRSTATKITPLFLLASTDEWKGGERFVRDMRSPRGDA
jgi:hypothetical protein